MNKPIRISLTRKEIPVSLEANDGTVTELKLVELDGKGHQNYMEFLGGALRFDAEGKPLPVDSSRVGQSTLRLVHLCLRRKQEGGWAQVGEKELQEWPSIAIRALYDAAAELNELRAKKEDPRKNDQPETNTGGIDSPTD